MLVSKTIGKQTLALDINHLFISFDKKEVLKDINLKIYPGEFVGLIGPNGAGKSTLLNLILGLKTPSSGEIKIFEKKIKDNRGAIGYVPQKLHLEPQTPLRGIDLVGLGLDGNRWGVPWRGKRNKKKIKEVLEAVSASEFANKPVGKLSGGEQQRLLIAQALLGNPKILFLDEPLSNLDIKSSYEIVKLVSNICRTKNIAVVFVSHDMNPLLKAMDRVIYLNSGLAVIGKTDEVFQSNVLSDLYGYKVEVLHINNRMLIVGNDGSSLNEEEL